MLLKTLYVVIIMFPFITFITKNPIILSLLVILFTSISSSCMLFFTSSWMAIIPMLIFLGGMMVLFTYVSSLSTSEKFFIYNNFKTSQLLFLITPIIFTIPIFSSMTRNSEKTDNLKIIFDHTGFSNIILLSIVIIIALLICVKMSQNFKGSLKWKF